jgi:phospholipid N-methyltransferase
MNAAVSMGDDLTEHERRAAELFETGHTLADELAAMLDPRPGQRVLEPSAGRGALIRAVRRRCRKAEIVAVEALPKLCASLDRQGFGARCTDFLEIRPGDLGELVDRVLMNPPFSRQQDIAHVRHAVRFLRPGGVLVAVMSAGVKFRQDRAATEFRAYVEGIGGTIQDLPEGSFAAAGTMVRTVVVRLVQPGGADAVEPPAEPEVTAIEVASPYGPEWGACADCGGDRLLEELGESGLCTGCDLVRRQAEPSKPKSSAEANPFPTDELSIPKNVAELVRAFRLAEADLCAGYTLVRKAQEGLRDAFLDERFEVRDRYSRTALDFERPEEALREFRRTAWRSLVQRLELPRFMSAKAWSALSDKIDRTEPPEVTEENVFGLAKQYRDGFEDMIRESVREVFDFLRPHHTDYKTNAKVKWQVGRKVILTYWCESGYSGSGFRPSYHHYQEMTSLENVFSNLDGKGFANKSLNRSLLAQAIETSKDGHGETEYFKFKCYGNRNVHLEFKRMDLVNRLNLIAGGGALKPKAEHQ